MQIIFMADTIMLISLGAALFNSVATTFILIVKLIMVLYFRKKYQSCLEKAELIHGHKTSQEQQS